MYFGFKNISIHYGKKKVIDDLTFSFQKGKITTIIGQNGCGKSSLLKTISRIVSYDQGAILLEDKNINCYKRKEIAKKIAYLPQLHESPDDIDVKTLVSYGRYPYMRMGKRMTKEDEKVIEESIRVSGLSELANQSISTLSGGEKQRAWIAMTICQQPEILILDEPTTYLDISYQIEVLELIKQLNIKWNMTIIMVLHDLNLAARYSDYLYAIKDRKVFIEGRSADVLNQKNLEELFQIQAEIFYDKKHECPFFIPNKTTIIKENI